jgi:hypothetical protein
MARKLQIKIASAVVVALSVKEMGRKRNKCWIG